MKKILFFIPTLTGGGAEKVLLTLANNLVLHNFDVSVYTLINKGVYIDQLDERIKYRSIISVKNSFAEFCLCYIIQFILPARLTYRLFIKDKFDYEVAYLEGFPLKLIAASNQKKSNKYAWIHSDLNLSSEAERTFGNLQANIKCYKRMDKIFCVSAAVKESFIKRFGITDKVYVQHNVIDEEEIMSLATQPIADFFKQADTLSLVAIGRLTYLKGFDRLLLSIKRILDDNIKVHLTILGSGEDWAALNKVIKDNQLEPHISLLGFKRNPYPYLLHADIFVCSSLYEGFSTVACEAIILGKPVITTDCAGMKELLGAHNEYGLVVANNEDALYHGIKQMVTKDWPHYEKMSKKRALWLTKNQRIAEHKEIFA